MTSKVRVKVDGLTGTSRVEIPKDATLADARTRIHAAVQSGGPTEGSWLSLNKQVPLESGNSPLFFSLVRPGDLVYLMPPNGRQPQMARTSTPPASNVRAPEATTAATPSTTSTTPASITSRMRASPDPPSQSCTVGSRSVTGAAKPGSQSAGGASEAKQNTPGSYKPVASAHSGSGNDAAVDAFIREAMASWRPPLAAGQAAALALLEAQTAVERGEARAAITAVVHAAILDAGLAADPALGPQGTVPKASPNGMMCCTYRLRAEDASPCCTLRSFDMCGSQLCYVHVGGDGARKSCRQLLLPHGLVTRAKALMPKPPTSAVAASALTQELAPAPDAASNGAAEMDAEDLGHAAVSPVRGRADAGGGGEGGAEDGPVTRSVADAVTWLRATPSLEAVYWQARDTLALWVLCAVHAAAGLAAPWGLLALPTELQTRVLRCLEWRKVVALTGTCRALRNLASADEVWRPLWHQEFGADCAVPENVSIMAAFATKWTARLQRQREEEALRRHRAPRFPQRIIRPHPFGLAQPPGIVGGDYDRLPALGGALGRQWGDPFQTGFRPLGGLNGGLHGLGSGRGPHRLH